MATPLIHVPCRSQVEEAERRVEEEAKRAERLERGKEDADAKVYRLEETLGEIKEERHNLRTALEERDRLLR